MNPLLQIKNLSVDFISESGTTHALKIFLLLLTVVKSLRSLGNRAQENRLLPFLFYNCFHRHRHNIHPVKYCFPKPGRKSLIS